MNVSKKLLNNFFRVYMLPLNCILKHVNKKHRMRLIIEMLKRLRNKDDYCRVSFFPKKIDDPEIRATPIDFSDTAIVIQGPIVTRDDFTLNTVKMYRQYYQNIKVIVSTWKDSDPESLSELTKEGALVVCSEYPPYNGRGNINYQMVSSAAGIKKAGELKLKYAIKTRTDQRLYNPSAMALIRGIYKDDRLVLLGGISNSYCTRAFYISDFLAYGSVADMALLFNGEQMNQITTKAIENIINTDDFKTYKSRALHAEKNCRASMARAPGMDALYYSCPEVILAHQYYLKKSGIQDANIRMNWGHYFDFLMHYAVIVDAESLGFYWLKYDAQVCQSTWYDRDGKLDTGRWFSIMQSKDAIQAKNMDDRETDVMGFEKS